MAIAGTIDGEVDLKLNASEILVEHNAAITAAERSRWDPTEPVVFLQGGRLGFS